MRSSHGESILHQEEGLASKDQARMDFEFFKLGYETSIFIFFYTRFINNKSIILVVDSL